MRLVRVPLGRVHRKAGIVDRSMLSIGGVRARISTILRRRGDRSMLSIGGVRGRISSILRRRGVVKGWRGEMRGRGLLSQDAILRVWMVGVEGIKDRSVLVVAWIHGSLRARLHPLFKVPNSTHTLVFSSQSSFQIIAPLTHTTPTGIRVSR
jgi:hypothetical protein